MFANFRSTYQSQREKNSHANLANLGDSQEGANQSAATKNTKQYDPQAAQLPKCDTEGSSCFPAPSKIPRYIRNGSANASVSNSSSTAASAVASPVQRKLQNKQQLMKQGLCAKRDEEENSFDAESIGLAEKGGMLNIFCIYFKSNLSWLYKNNTI